MSTGMVFRVTAILAFGVGTAWMLAPEAVLEAWGVLPDPMLRFVGRQQAALLLAAGLLLWVARDSRPSPARNAIVIGGFWAGLFVAVLWLDGVTSGVVPAGGLIAVAVGAAVAILFAGAGAAARRAGDQPPGTERAGRRERAGAVRGRRRRQNASAASGTSDASRSST